MKRTTFLGHLSLFLCFSLVHAALAMGQQVEKERPAQAYLFAGLGTSFSMNAAGEFARVGGGGEAKLYKGFGLGCEIGYYGAAQWMGGGIPVLYANGLYVLEIQDNPKIQPFLTA